MHRSSLPRSGTGASSIMVIIMVVSMTVFGMLSVVSVYTEQKLTQKTVDTFSLRYEADAQAQRVIARIDEALLASDETTMRANVERIDGVSLSVDGDEIHFTQTISQEMYLVVVLGNLNPGSASDRYVVLVYQQVNESEWNPDTGITIY